MTAARIIFIILYLAVLAAYFFSETSGNFKRRAVNKIALASLFLGCAIVAYFRWRSFPGIDLLVLAGLLFAFLGDIALLWSMSKAGICFGAANILFIIYEFLVFSRLGTDAAWLVAVAAAAALLWGAIMRQNSKGVLPFVEKSGRKYAVYLLSVTISGLMGLMLACRSGRPALGHLGTGLFLMMLSDYFLTVYSFRKPSKALLRTNSAAYFTGMLLAAVSFFLPAP